MHKTEYTSLLASFLLYPLYAMFPPMTKEEFLL